MICVFLGEEMHVQQNLNVDTSFKKKLGAFGIIDNRETGSFATSNPSQLAFPTPRNLALGTCPLLSEILK